MISGTTHLDHEQMHVSANPDINTISASGDSIHPPYRYLSLDKREFRVLQLNPGDDDEELSAVLMHVSLDDDPPSQYEATSYAWTNPAVTTVMKVKGKLHRVPTSAAEVLCSVQKSSGVRSIWIDAICINQSDVSEREYQVALMRDIYSRGSRNLIYLDTGDEDDASNLQVFDDVVAELIRESGGASRINKLLDTQSQTFRQRPGGLLEPLHDHHALYSLHRLPWFSRLWVLQEAVLSASNICLYGRHTRSLFDLLAPSAYIMHAYRVQGGLWTTFNNVRTLFQAVYRGHSDDTKNESSSYAWLSRTLEELLQTSSRFHASVPHDHVFGLLGLLNPKDVNQLRLLEVQGGTDSLLSPDYSKPEKQVFTDASRAALISHNWMSLLRYINHSSQESVSGRELPSWVLDLRARSGHGQETSMFRENYIGSHQSRKQTISPLSSSTLPIKGRVVDFIVGMGSVLSNSTDWLHIHDFVKASAQVCRCTSLHDSDSQAVHALSRALVAGNVVDQRLFTCTLMAEGFPTWLAWVEEKGSGGDNSSSAYHEAFNISMHRRVFRTENGLVGLGSQCMQEGDHVVMFYECLWPSVARPAQDGQRWHFVGLCYVDGMMDGEIWERSGGEQADSDQLFHLR